jgi:hypothetical protein
VADVLRAEGVAGKIVATGYADSRINEVDPGLLPDERAQQARRVELVIHGSQ